MTYHPGFRPFKSILNKHLPILNISHRLSQAVKNPPLVACYRLPPMFKNFLVQATFKTSQPLYTGNSQCHQAHSTTCQYIKAINKFKSSVIGKVYCTKASADSKTTNVVYVIKYTKCAMQYVGEMENALHIQMNNHQSDIKNRRLEKIAAKHLNPLTTL